MDTSFLKPLYRRRGPWCSVYLSTERDETDAAHKTELRWRELRGRLAELGAREKDLRAVDGEIGSDRGIPRPHDRAIFAAHAEVALVHELRAPVTDSHAAFGELPDLVPLLAEMRDLGPHLLAFADHGGADVELHGAGSPSAGERVDGQARAVSTRVAQIAEEHAVATIALSGDARVRATVLAELGPGWRSRAVELPGSDAPGADPEAVRRQAARAAAECEQAWRANLVDRYAAGLAHDRAVEGLEASVESLRNGEVETLLVRHDVPQAAAPVWWGPDPGQLAVHPEQLQSTRAPQIRHGRAVDALVRAAALEGGDLLLLSGSEPGPREAAGAILRRG